MSKRDYATNPVWDTAVDIADLPDTASIQEAIAETNYSVGWREPGDVKDATTVDPKVLMHECMLIVTEVAEAAEEIRGSATNPHKLGLYFVDPFNDSVFYPNQTDVVGADNKFLLRKPEGVPAELADVVIRCYDFADKYGIDLDFAIKSKMLYNRSRPRRHGGKAV